MEAEEVISETINRRGYLVINSDFALMPLPYRLRGYIKVLGNQGHRDTDSLPAPLYAYQSTDLADFRAQQKCQHEFGFHGSGNPADNSYFFYRVRTD
jgi:hypothetical protein